MGDLGSHPGRKQEKRQGKEVLGLAHPIQINLFEEFHAHSDPLELDTNDHRFVPKKTPCPRRAPPSALQDSLSGLKSNRVKQVIRPPAKCLTPPHEASWPDANQRSREIHKPR